MNEPKFTPNDLTFAVLMGAQRRRIVQLITKGLGVPASCFVEPVPHGFLIPKRMGDYIAKRAGHFVDGEWLGQRRYRAHLRRLMPMRSKAFRPRRRKLTPADVAAMPALLAAVNAFADNTRTTQRRG